MNRYHRIRMLNIIFLFLYILISILFREVIPTIHSNINNHHLEFTMEENDLKYFIISIEHAYYFVKHPYTRRPCLPCFEVARLLNKDETYVSQLVIKQE